MKTQSTICLLFIFICLQVSCQTKDKETPREKKQVVEVTTLEPVRTIEAIDDTVFFKEVDIYAKGNYVVISDNSKSRLIVTDTTFNLRYITGTKGEGPGEMQYAQLPLIADSIIYVEDAGNRRMNIYDLRNGAYIRSFRSPRYGIRNPFALNREGKIYMSVHPYPDINRRENTIIQLDQEGNILKTFGKFYPYPNEDEIAKRNYRYVQLNEKDQVISTGRSLGFIEIHDKQGELLQKYDISHYEPIKRALDSMLVDVKKDPKLKNMINSLIIRAIYRKNRLYMTFTDRIGDKKSYRIKNTRHVLVFYLTDKECRLEKIFRLASTPDDQLIHYEALQIDEEAKYLYVQGLLTYQIYVYKLPETDD